MCRWQGVPPRTCRIAWARSSSGTRESRIQLAPLTIPLLRIRAKLAMDATKKLHNAGYVHGDLRSPNFMISTKDERVCVLDFDYAGRKGETTYPYFLSKRIPWHNEVKGGGLIKDYHDIYLLEKSISERF